MRSKIDEKLDRRGGGRRGKRAAAPVKGGKALQRLFSFLGPRDPRMIADVVESVIRRPRAPIVLVPPVRLSEAVPFASR